MPIHFFYEDCSFRVQNTKRIKTWLLEVLDKENASAGNINYIICSDNYLLEINRRYLNHDYYTDIITFPCSELPEPMEADIFISVDRVRENAASLEKEFSNEFHRVLVHGILHLLGYNDSSKDEKQEMRKKEDSCLSLRDF
ncbi:rRNA maturation RNase YbeY [Hyphobacterium sp. CCMP332]|nr:rRNA maturation RNase YbeY [Hyphobacterium sp. CCMP332]